MAVVNQYDFVGIDNDTTNTELNPFGAGSPLVSETYVFKSILVSSAINLKRSFSLLSPVLILLER